MRGTAGPYCGTGEVRGNETSRGQGQAVTPPKEATAESAVPRGRLQGRIAAGRAPSGDAYGAEDRAAVRACRAAEAIGRMSSLNSGAAAAVLTVCAHAGQTGRDAIGAVLRQNGLTSASLAVRQMGRVGATTRPIGGRRLTLASGETAGLAVSQKGICIARVSPSSEIAAGGHGGRASGLGSDSTRTGVSLAAAIDGVAAPAMAERAAISRSPGAAKAEAVSATTAVTTGPTRTMRTATGGAAGAIKIAAQGR